MNEVDQEIHAVINCKEWMVEYMILMMEYKQRYNEGIGQGIKVFILDKIEDSVPREKIVEKLQKGMHPYAKYRHQKKYFE